MSDKPQCVVVLIGNDDKEEDEDEEDDDDEEEEHGDEQEYDNEEEEEDDGDEDGREGMVTLACACAQRLDDVLKYTEMFSGHPVCGNPILLLDKSKEEIMEGIQKAVQLVKNHDASWSAIYYAGPSFWDKDTGEIVIQPKADGGEIRLEKQVKQ